MKNEKIVNKDLEFNLYSEILVIDVEINKFINLISKGGYISEEEYIYLDKFIYDYYKEYKIIKKMLPMSVEDGSNKIINLHNKFCDIIQFKKTLYNNLKLEQRYINDIDNLNIEITNYLDSLYKGIECIASIQPYDSKNIIGSCRQYINKQDIYVNGKVREQMLANLEKYEVLKKELDICLNLLNQLDKVKNIEYELDYFNDYINNTILIPLDKLSDFNLIYKEKIEIYMDLKNHKDILNKLLKKERYKKILKYIKLLKDIVFIKENYECYKLLIEEILDLDEAREIIKLMLHSNRYITLREIDLFKSYNENSINKAFEINRKLSKLDKKTSDRLYRICKRENKLDYTYEIIKNFDIYINRHNEEILYKSLEKYKYIFDNVEGKPLSDEQRRAILKDEHRNLLLAPAGSGKTLTIIGKIKYLIESKLCNSDEILVLAFNRENAKELNDRLFNELGLEITTSTFHALGKDIISQVEGKTCSVKDQIEADIKRILEAQFNQSYKFKEQVVEFIAYFLIPIKSYYDFKSYKEEILYRKQHNLSTFKNEIVKSYCELLISNFLTLRNIPYEYEEEYKNTSIKYKPDFHIKNTNIYIEFWACDRRNEVPKYFESKNNLSPTEYYNDCIENKRKIHKENNTILIEVSYADFQRKKLLKTLESKLKDVGVNINNKISEEEKDKIINNSVFLETLVNMLKEFIVGVKNNQLCIATLYKNLRRYHYNDYLKKRAEKFLEIFNVVYDEYESNLKDNGLNDFSDLINKATYYCNSGKYKSNFKYIIIDEFQDISRQRKKLVDAILKQNENIKLFCVGDDWQSIYGFSESDIKITTEFNNYYNFSKQHFLTTTHRFNKNILYLTSRFIRKDNLLTAKSGLNTTINNNDRVEIYSLQDRKLIGQKVDEILLKLDSNLSVLLLGRYESDSKEFLSNKFKFRSNEVYYKDRTDLRISFSTIHRSKGLEADVVIILNNLDDLKGFPSKIEDDTLLELIHGNTYEELKLEERRVFYVALTRAKKRLILITVNLEQSDYIKEIVDSYEYRYCIEKYISKQKSVPKCNVCGSYMKKVCINKVEKWGCSSYPYCPNRYKVK